MVDAFGVAQFMKAVGEMARGTKQQQPSVMPAWERERLDSRKPPRVTRIHHEYRRDANDAKLDIDLTNLCHVAFVFGPDQIKAIRKHLPPHLAGSYSRFDLITACIWKCRTLALNPDPEEVVQVTCAVNGRGKNLGLDLPPGYYGNVVFFLNAISKAGALCQNGLGYAAELLKKAKLEMDEECIRSVADLIVTRQPAGYKVKGNFFVSDLTKVGFSEVDLGWGYPEYAGHPGSFPSIAHYMKSGKKEEDGIVVPMCLSKLDMERFKRELKKIMEDPIPSLTIHPPVNKILSLL